MTFSNLVNKSWRATQRKIKKTFMKNDSAWIVFRPVFGYDSKLRLWYQLWILTNENKLRLLRTRKKLELKNKKTVSVRKKKHERISYTKKFCALYFKKVFFLSFFFIFDFFCYLFIFLFSWKLSGIFSLIRRTLNSKRGCCLVSIVQHPLHLQYTHSGMSGLGFRYMRQA